MIIKNKKQALQYINHFKEIYLKSFFDENEEETKYYIDIPKIIKFENHSENISHQLCYVLSFIFQIEKIIKEEDN